MDKKAITLTVFLFVLIHFVSAQNCGTIEKNTTEKDRKYFVDFESYALTNVDSILLNINFDDTALVIKIILGGTKSEDYEAFFSNKKVNIKRIGFNDFSAIKMDSLILSNREKRHEIKYKKLTKKYYYLVKKDKSTEVISKKLRKPQFIQIDRKRVSTIPLLFKMYPIYTYGEYTLIMYSIYSNKYGIPFIYEICKSQ